MPRSKPDILHLPVRPKENEQRVVGCDVCGAEHDNTLQAYLDFCATHGQQCPFAGLSQDEKATMRKRAVTVTSGQESRP